MLQKIPSLFIIKNRNRAKLNKSLFQDFNLHGGSEWKLNPSFLKGRVRYGPAFFVQIFNGLKKFRKWIQRAPSC